MKTIARLRALILFAAFAFAGSMGTASAVPPGGGGGGGINTCVTCDCEYTFYGYVLCSCPTGQAGGSACEISGGNWQTCSLYAGPCLPGIGGGGIGF